MAKESSPVTVTHISYCKVPDTRMLWVLDLKDESDAAII